MRSLPHVFVFGLASVHAGSIDGVAATEVDYILVVDQPQSSIGEPPVEPWDMGGGGALSVAGPGLSGGCAGSLMMDLVAVGFERGPNGVAEAGGGDDVSLGPVNARWSIADTAWDARSGRHALTDSPEGLYGASWDHHVRPDRAFDLSGASTAHLEFHHHWDLRLMATQDVATVDVRPDGSEWQTVREYRHRGGFFGSFLAESIDLSSFLGTSIEIRFGIDTSSSRQADGWVIDDVELRVDGAPALFDDFETGLDGWVVEGAWGLTPAEIVSVPHLDRSETPLTLPISRDRYGVRNAVVYGSRLVSNPTGLPSALGEGIGVTWIVAEYRGLSDGKLVRNLPPVWVR